MLDPDAASVSPNSDSDDEVTIAGNQTQNSQQTQSPNQQTQQAPQSNQPIDQTPQQNAQTNTQQQETASNQPRTPSPSSSRSGSPEGFETPSLAIINPDSSEEEDSVTRDLTRNIRMAGRRLEMLELKYPYEEEDPCDKETDPANTEEENLKIIQYRRQREKDEQMQKCMETLSLQQSEKHKPSFNGDKDKKPDSHILLVEDWKDKHNISDSRILRRFKETLEGSARLWYEELDMTGMTWEKMQQEFIREYTKEGKSNFQIKYDQSHLRFDPEKDNIKEFIRDIKTTGKILKQSDEEIRQTLAEAVPPEMYYVASSCQSLEKLCEFLTNTLNSRRMRKEKAATAGTSSPFMTMQTSTENKPQQQPNPPPQDRSPQRPRPFKPWITPSRRGRPSYSQPPPPRRYDNRNYRDDRTPRDNRNFRGRSFNRSNQRGGYNQGGYNPRFNRQRSFNRGPRRWNNYDNRSQSPRFRSQSRDRFNRNRFRSFSESRERYNPRTTRRFISPKPPPATYRDSDNRRQQKIDSTRCFRCNEPGHWAAECPLVPAIRQRYPSQDGRRPRSVSFRFQETEYEDGYTDVETDDEMQQEN